MTTLQNDEKNLSNVQRVIVIALPIVVGLSIVLFTEMKYLLSQGEILKYGYIDLVCSFMGPAIGHSVSFVVIALIIRSLIRQGVKKKSVYIRLSFMLIPVSIVTAYWLSIYIDPLALGALWFINLPIIFFAFFVGKFVTA